MTWLADCIFLMKTNTWWAFPVVRVYCWLMFGLSTGATPEPFLQQCYLPQWSSAVHGMGLFCTRLRTLPLNVKFVVNLIPPACWGPSEWQPCLLVYWQPLPCFMLPTNMMGVCSSSLPRLLMNMLEYSPYYQPLRNITYHWLHFEPPLSPVVQPVVLPHLLHDSSDWLKRFHWTLSTAFVKSN